MTYKLEPGLSRITSPVSFLLPDGKRIEYCSGAEACEVVFEHKYVVESMRAVNSSIEIILSEVESLNADETFF